ncbi:SGF29 tudor-like domain-containing protein [Hypoxylon trugodes]|uniref:SGF29 tudor-like domain-containing protein n=1 Tax=Hypoxylon trugodes TaxID=326681 RepID=UPI00218DD7D1|nr:SGF29 tudor-like domain-containing protein [Hypoxylon trugodes]KAI1394442.1 SGF29 tudor-like domain-containing protein [Hypoxylon trugodes]
MGADKKTKRNLNKLASSLGQAWDDPVSPRRRRGSTTTSRSSVTQDQDQDQPRRLESRNSETRAIILPPEPEEENPRRMSSRGSQRRGPNRNSEIGEHGEELGMWKDIKEKIPGAADAFNLSNQTVLDIRNQEKLMAEKRENNSITAEDYNELDKLFRKGVRQNDTASQILTETIEKLKVLRAVQKAKEDQQEVNTSRSSTQRNKESAAAASSLYDFDGSGESSVPSPNPAVPRRMGGGAGSRGDRDSVPPRLDRSTPAAKAGSAEPQTGTAASSIRSKQTFAKDDEVAFKPKPVNNEQTDWILGIVQDVRGEGKSRRYRVLDADVDENGHQKDFRTSASSMILIPKEGTVLPPLETGKTVLALYPNTTTFYKAEVIGMDGDGKVNLKFEGEESSNTMQAVTRRHVVEYRG